jgi:two-component system response regulator PilR (NtrC family)
LAKLTGANKQDRPTLSTAAFAALQQYHFPGNVRELENILERALALYDGNRIENDDLNLPVNAHKVVKSPEYDPTLGTLEEHLQKIEKKAISLVLQENEWDKAAAAKQLGLSFRSLSYRLKKLEMDN